MYISLNHAVCHYDLLASSATSPSLSSIQYLILGNFQKKMASNHGRVAHLLPLAYKHKVSQWLEEDCPDFDYGGFVVGETSAEANLLGKSTVSHLIIFPEATTKDIHPSPPPFS